MVSLATHFSAFVFLFLIGIRRLFCSFSIFLNNPSQYRSKLWYLSEPKWKNFDFYFLLIALPIASFCDIFFFLAVSGHPTYRFSLFQQSLLIFLFWALLILIILKESLDLSSVPESFVFICGAVAFLFEYKMNGNGILGLGSVGYEILDGLALVCAACCLYLSIWPSAFFAEFLLSSGIILKGTWVVQVGLTFYTDAFGLKGCGKIAVVRDHGQADVLCDLEEDKFRGMALIKLLFIGHVTVVLITCFTLFGVLHRNSNMRSGEASGPLLARIRSEATVMNQPPEFEIE
ncbi:hypothetical protein M9H77_35684 [Catharanthus roseus]|uniref:Uncharacterized protein n=1 Tax=Catharanthus roseus TaxID=4058 RepID=A0ACB9ZRF5_CATRO|nr:hypothetical protein M9H77_35684 [Catharanthus roseus]